MEKILNLAQEIFGHVETVEPTIAHKVKAAVSAIVDEAQGLSNAFTLAVASAPNGDAGTSPVTVPASAAIEASQIAAPQPALTDPKCAKCGLPCPANGKNNCRC